MSSALADSESSFQMWTGMRPSHTCIHTPPQRHPSTHLQPCLASVVKLVLSLDGAADGEVTLQMGRGCGITSAERGGE